MSEVYRNATYLVTHTGGNSESSSNLRTLFGGDSHAAAISLILSESVKMQRQYYKIHIKKLHMEKLHCNYKWNTVSISKQTSQFLCTRPKLVLLKTISKSSEQILSTCLKDFRLHYHSGITKRHKLKKRQ